MTGTEALNWPKSMSLPGNQVTDKQAKVRVEAWGDRDSAPTPPNPNNRPQSPRRDADGY